MPSEPERPPSPLRLRLAAAPALAFALLALAAIVIQDHTRALPLGLFNEGEYAYRWLSLVCLAGTVLACAVFASELSSGRRLAAGSLLRRLLVSFLLLEAIVTGFDLVISKSPHVQLGGPYFERENSSGDFVFLRRAHPGSPYGFRSLAPAPPVPRAKRILFLGDSYTEGSGRGLACNYPEVVGRELAERFGENVEILNAGVGGYGPRESAKLLRLLRDDGFRFDAIVLSLFLENDVTDDLPATDRRVIGGMNERVPHSVFLRAFHPLNTRTFRYALMIWRLGTLSGAERNAAHRENAECATTPEPFPAELDGHLRRYVTRRVRGSERALEPGGDAELVAAVHDITVQAQEMGAPLVVVLFPDRILADAELRAVFPPDVADNPAPRRVHDRIVTRLESLPLIDTLPVIAKLPRAYRESDTHLSDAGNVAAGEYVADRLAELLPELGN